MPEKSSISAVGAYPIAQERAGKNAESFLRALFHLLDEHDVRYCVLHSWESLPERLSSDLDLAVRRDDAQKLVTVFQELHGLGYIATQCINYLTHGFGLAFCWFDGSTPETALVDVIFEHRRGGLILATGEELVADRKRHGCFWISAPGTEFGYLLAKKTWKRRASPKQAVRLKYLVGKIGQDEAERIACRFLSPAAAARIVEACVDGTIHTELQTGPRELRRSALVRFPLRAIRQLAEESRRFVARSMRPAGILIAVLGPDGAGKSSVVDSLTAEFICPYRRRYVYHWRPQVIAGRKSSGPITEPHARPLRGWFSSMALLLVFFVDYWSGYIFAIRPKLTRGCAVVFDRYFHDLLVDPRRYRYGGPSWFAALLSRLVPEPDLILQARADPATIFSRKGELPAAEIERQLKKYEQLRFRHSVQVSVPTDCALDRTLRAVAIPVIQLMNARFNQRTWSWTKLEKVVVER